jgi:hypothetical protein
MQAAQARILLEPAVVMEDAVHEAVRFAVKHSMSVKLRDASARDRMAAVVEAAARRAQTMVYAAGGDGDLAYTEALQSVFRMEGVARTREEREALRRLEVLEPAWLFEPPGSDYDFDD